jgi:hypothetical protein
MPHPYAPVVYPAGQVPSPTSPPAAPAPSNRAAYVAVGVVFAGLVAYEAIKYWARQEARR